MASQREILTKICRAAKNFSQKYQKGKKISKFWKGGISAWWANS
jgi:hypothetical protein